jgi:DedD protein
MAGNGKRGGGDRVLESRHLVGLFLGVVLLCGVFFTLGYVMGRTQFGGVVRADPPTRISGPNPKPTTRETPATAPTAKTSGDSGNGWDSDPVKPADKHVESPAPVKAPAAVPATLNKTAKPPAPAPVKAPAAKESQRFQPPAISKTSIILQVAATKQQRDALEMADILQKKKFPSFVANSPADSFYHVQVGPYSDLASAESAKRALEQLGFKSIIKH